MFYALNNIIAPKLFLFFFILFLSVSGQNKGDYMHFIDSADNHIDENIKRAALFLDSIPEPIEKTIAGRMAKYYLLKALIADDDNRAPELYQDYILALKYAEKEENYKIAGQVCLELFSNIYFFKRDSSANKYLEKAKKYYKLSGYNHGLIEIEQTVSYIKYLDKDYESCNRLILEKLDAYKNIKDDGYYHLFALYMLTSNYIHLDDFGKAHRHFKTFKSLEKDTTIVAYNYSSFDAGIHISFAEEFFKKKQIDSTFSYLSYLSKYRGTSSMGEDITKSYFELYADVYKYSGNLDASRAYLDSLKIYGDKMFKNIVDASFEINASLLKTESELEIESERSYINGLLVVFLFCVLILVCLLYFVFYRKHKFKLNDFIEQLGAFSYLKTNNEKLTLKIHGLEEYINNIKKEIKDISGFDEVSQKEKIKELYTTLHLSSSTILDKSESHLELINDLNVDFFRQLSERHPELNNSEIIICYYLFIDFKNKEIAVFLNMSVRAIESKRYRITKKINLDKEKMTLVNYLKETFIDANKVF